VRFVDFFLQNDDILDFPETDGLAGHPAARGPGRTRDEVAGDQFPGLGRG